MLEIMDQINISAPSLVCVCVDSIENGNITGRFYHKYKKEAEEFRSVSMLLDKMDRLFDRIDFPQSSTRRRTFHPKDEPNKKKKEAVQVADTKEIMGHSGDKGTFIVQVKYRQNSTWQGEVTWTERRQKQYFRSALELLKLIDSALDMNEEEAPLNIEE
ncbi:MAG: hypothetical protein ACI4OO_02425 [Otoolea sp.]